MSEEVKQNCEESETKEDVAEEKDTLEEEKPDTSEEQKEETKEETPAAEEVKVEPEVVDYYDKWLRVTAEYQNYRTRTIKEKEEIYQNANAKFIEGLLEVIDNFERAMQTRPENDKFADGIELIYKQFLAVLEKNHVKEIPAKGEKFDPVVHMAVQMMPVEGMESDMVAEVVKKGYTLNDKVIRPAMVVVSQ